MKKYLLVLFTVLTSTASASTVHENIKLFHLQKASPNAHDVVIEINYRLADKCNNVLPVDQIVKKETLFSFLLALRSVNENAFSTKAYQSALNGLKCDDLGAGMPK